jgi:energy-coupling factor transport system permease protein
VALAAAPRRRMNRRSLHPAAWWAWAGAVAIAAVKTTNPILLALLAAAVGFVVAARRTTAPWSRSFGTFLRLGAAVIVIRVAIQILFGIRLPGHQLFALPRVGLPHWAEGVSIGGPVTVESVLSAVYQGLRLAVILLCFGAANALASPYRLLRCLPAVLYEAGVAVTVALAFAPEAVMAAADIREARRLRGRPTRGIAGLRGLAVPVLQTALDRSLELAASMDARGYGRRVAAPDRVRRLAGFATAVGLLAISAGTYGLLDTGSPAALGLPVLAAGAALLAAAIVARGRRSPRTRYRPDAWAGAEWLVALAGLATLGAFLIAGWIGHAGLNPGTFPLEAPRLAVVPAVGVGIALLPAYLAPRPA